ncbi:MAG: prolyl oligopeptidase family serine peptidase [Janthinobacterium lividum]
MNTPFTYPEARKSDQADDYHGTLVADPYRWLEDPDSAESRVWIEAENALSFGFLEKIPARKSIEERLTALWDYERYGAPFLQGGRYFFSKNDGLQNQSVWYVSESLDADPRVLLDPNTLSADGTVALSGLSISDDGKWLAYSLSAAGSDWTEWHVRSVDTGTDLADHLRWVKFSGASWAKDASGFYYSRYDAPPEGEELQQANYFPKLYFHVRGTEQSVDVLIYERPDEKEWSFGGRVSEDGAYLIIPVRQGTEPKNRLFYKPLTEPDVAVVELIPELKAQYRFLGNEGPVFWLQTNDAAPRSRVIAIDTQNPGKDQWQELIPEAAETLEGVSVVGNRFIAEYLKDACTQVKVFALDGTFEREVDLPGIGSAGGFGGKRAQTETFYAFTSFTAPTSIYRYDVPTGTSTLYRESEVAFEPGDFETSQIFYASADGTQIPMFLTHRKGLVRDGQNPTYLYGYGGFDISLTPSFSPAQIVWMEMGGILAVANLRGGGEYGAAWHDAGIQASKQNVFDDFIAAAEWLIAEKYTSTPKLAIGGGSNGGLLVGACLAQRPDLFGACLPAVGVLDMLRFQKFTIGWAWTSDYGSSDNAADFAYLYAYSPLHNLKPGTAYPATLITTGDHDDRVVPAHSFKFAAALQAAQSGPAPTLIRIETRAGHGAGKPTTKVIEEAADRWAFLVEVLGMEG